MVRIVVGMRAGGRNWWKVERKREEDMASGKSGSL